MTGLDVTQGEGCLENRRHPCCLQWDFPISDLSGVTPGLIRSSAAQKAWTGSPGLSRCPREKLFPIAAAVTSVSSHVHSLFHSSGKTGCEIGSFLQSHKAAFARVAWKAELNCKGEQRDRGRGCILREQVTNQLSISARHVTLTATPVVTEVTSS